MFIRLLPLTLATFAVGTDNFVIAGLLPRIAGDLRVTVASAGQLVTVFALTFALSAALLGGLTSGLDRRTALLFSLGVFAAGNLATALAGTYTLVMTARIVTALGAGLITSAASSTAGALAPPERRGWAMSLVLGGLSASTALGLPLGTVIGGVDWRLTVILIAALGLVSMAGIAAGLPPVSLPKSTVRQRLAPLREPWVLGVLGTTTLLFGGTYLLYTYVTPFLNRVPGSSLTTLTLLLAIFGFGTVAGTLISGRLSDRFRPERVLVFSLLGTLPVLAVSPWVTRSPVIAAVWCAIWGVCASIATVPQQHRLVNHRPSLSPTLLGLNSSAIYLGISAGGALGGWSLSWTSAGRLGLPASTLTALALLLAAVTFRAPASPEGGGDHGRAGDPAWTGHGSSTSAPHG